QHAVTFASGLAMGGLRPVVCIYSSFLQRAFDQVMLDVALHDQPVTFVLDRAGVTGPDGASHHGMFDLSYLRMIPNMALGAAANEADLCGLLEAALDHDGPAAIRFPKGSASAVPQLPADPLPLGVWEVVDEGEDVLLLATGSMVEPATKAAAQLREQGVAATVINARWIKPMDDRLIEWVDAHKLVVTVEDNVRAGGFGAAVLELLAPTGLAGRVRTLAAPDHFLRFGSQRAILKELGLDSNSIAESVGQFLTE
ncbi:MAG: 1-deoxy-D-xylulose-5-phosphate synthase, partial [bacterium]|nr:1-deoxy-D-xylulose-5-phosphate synthase [bacterium]